MKTAVSVSLGSSARDKEVTLALGGERILLRREGTDGDEAKLRRRFEELDGKVDALGLGGFELEIRLGARRYPLRAGRKLARGLRHTPVVDGGGLKQTLERRVFERAGLAGTRFRRALCLVGVDRFGLARAVAEVADEVVFADLYFALGIPLKIRSLPSLERVGRVLLPVVGLLPISMLYPTGEKQEQTRARYPALWQDVDLVAGDFHYIRTNMPDAMPGCTIVTNTTTEKDVQLLRDRGVKTLITTTPSIEGRSFGTNALEAALTALAGSRTELPAAKLDAMIDELDIRPGVTAL